jgi:hypothetical protein
MNRLLATIAATSAVLIVSVATAAAGTPVGPGGCNMLAASNTGLTQMMAGSQHGSGQTNMFEMLDRFSPCGG